MSGYGNHLCANYPSGVNQEMHDPQPSIEADPDSGEFQGFTCQSALDSALSMLARARRAVYLFPNHPVFREDLARAIRAVSEANHE